MQSAIKTVVDAIKVTTDNTKIIVDSTATKVDSIDVKVGTLLDGRVVKSVQRGEVSISSVTTVDVTIAPVNLNKSLLIISNSHTSGAGGAVLVRGQLIDQNTIKLTMGGTSAVVVCWQVVEFY